MNAIATVLAVIALVLCAAFVAVGVAGAIGKLKTDSWAGIRTSATLHSDASWKRGHQVAGPGLICAGVIALLGAVVGLAGSGAMALVAVVVALLVAVPLAGWVCGVGVRAAQGVVIAQEAADRAATAGADSDACESGAACASCSLAGACTLPT